MINNNASDLQENSSFKDEDNENEIYRNIENNSKYFEYQRPSPSEANKYLFDSIIEGMNINDESDFKEDANISEK